MIASTLVVSPKTDAPKVSSKLPGTLILKMSSGATPLSNSV
ncbi:MAG: hypothetical protein CM15mP107_0910 [Bacteroidota bacterium]|nr:MAG: hypothetical protein CM15mP107_0910 [Bacteroidota bacterium]